MTVAPIVPSARAAGPDRAAPRVDIVPLLRSYRDALMLARDPPASLALPRRLGRVQPRTSATRTSRARISAVRTSA